MNMKKILFLALGALSMHNLPAVDDDYCECVYNEFQDVAHLAAQSILELKRIFFPAGRNQPINHPIMRVHVDAHQMLGANVMPPLQVMPPNLPIIALLLWTNLWELR